MEIFRHFYSGFCKIVKSIDGSWEILEIMILFYFFSVPLTLIASLSWFPVRNVLHHSNDGVWRCQQKGPYCYRK